MAWGTGARSGSAISDASAVGQDTYVGALLDGQLSAPVKTDGTLARFVLSNWGANDAQFLPGGGWTPLIDHTTWVAQYGSILDYCHTRFPNAHVWVMYPWRADLPTQCTTLHGWIDEVLATRASFASAGPDEAVWLENGDNGATYTISGVHYSVAGATKCAQVWATALGY